MKVLNGTPFEFAPMVGRVRHPHPTVTLVVKGTFDLRHEGTVTPSEEQAIPDGDKFVDDDEERELLYPSDFAHHKPKADLLLVGKCHAPGGEAVPICKVTFAAGRLSRSLLVQGDSYWKRKFGLGVPTDPEPFTSMEIGWRNAFGGPGHAWNPAGKGSAPEEREDGTRRVPLPNVHDPEHPVTSKSNRSVPAGFGPVRPDWKPREGKTGSYKGRYKKERWPYLPEDFDWSWYNAAPVPLQYDGYLRGDEDLSFENLHREIPEYRTVLPGLRIRCFLDEIVDGGTALREVPMHLDTLWVDMEQEKLVLVWRGIENVRDTELDDYENVVVLSEPVAESPAPLAQCEEEKDRLLREDRGEPPPSREEPPLEEEAAAEEAAIREQMAAAGVDLDKTESETEADPERDAEAARKFAEEHEIPEDDMAALFAPALTADQLQERYEAGETFDGENLAQLDLSGRKLQGIVLKNAQLTGADLSGADLTGADLNGAVLRDANLEGAILDRTELEDAFLAGSRLDHVSMRQAKLDGAMLAATAMTGADLSGSRANGADLAGAKLKNANFSEIEWEGCDLVGADVTGAKFENASLHDCDLGECKGTEADFTGADLAGARFTEGACLDGAVFLEVHAPHSMWEGADLEEADFTRAQLTGADFSKTNLHGACLSLARARKALFDRADLREADLREIDAFRGSFEKADLTAADLRGANLYEAEFIEAAVEGARLEQANVKATKLA